MMRATEAQPDQREAATNWRAEESELQRQLRDLICLAVVGDHVRWVTDDDELGDWLAQAAGEWRSWADRVAKQLVVSGVAPDGRVRSLAKDISLNWVPEGWLPAEQARRLVAERLAAVAGWARFRHSQADGPDVQLFGFVSTGLEPQLRALRDIATAPRGSHEPHGRKIGTDGVASVNSRGQAERSRAMQVGKPTGTHTIEGLTERASQAEPETTAVEKPAGPARAKQDEMQAR